MGTKVTDNDFRCDSHLDTSNFERRTFAGHENDDNEVCTYCGSLVNTPVKTHTPIKRDRYGRTPQQNAALKDAARKRMEANASPSVERTPALEDAYSQYISDGLADTDGWFVPESFDQWASVYAKTVDNTVRKAINLKW